MAESFGARLRQQRERQQIALTSIAEQTKIGLSLLEGLERDDVGRWPTGIYRRSFIRSYAQAIGLDPDVVARDFLELYPDPAAIDHASPSTGGAGDADGQTPPTRLRSLIDRAIDAIPGHRVPRSVLNLGTTIEISKAAPSDSTTAAPPPEPDLTAAAHLCTELARVMEPREVVPLLEGAARVLGAVGLIVWVSDPHQTTLRPALAHGYSDQVLAQLPCVSRDSDNATAAAFRSGETRMVHGTESATGALVIPLMTPAGCGGVFAVELPNGRERSEWVRALATIFSAQLATLVGFAPISKAVNA